MRATGFPESVSSCDNSLYKKLFMKENAFAAACGMMTFPATIGIFQHLIWKQINLAAHHKFAPLCGFLTVGTGAFLSCVVTSTVHDAFLGVYPMVSLTKQDLATYTFLSITQFYILSRSFFRPLPSHVLKPGAFAQKFIVLHDYDVKVTQSKKNQIQSLGRKHGCHTCGKVYTPLHYLYKLTMAKFFPENFKLRALYYADHSPPLALANAKGKSSGVLYPQCKSCSYMQSASVKAALSSNSSRLPSRGFVTHALRFKLWKLWIPWPLLLSSDYFVNMATDFVQFVIDKL